MDKMWLWIEWLKDPNLVSSVQRYFGVLPSYEVDSAFSNITNSVASNQVENNVSGLNSSQPEAKKYVVTSQFWYYVFLVSTYLGDELFYSLFFSFLFWNIDAVIARKTFFIWGVSLSLGQVMKDYIKWPRPPYPPVYCLQKKWSQEYGMPSTHAVIGVTIPFSLLYFAMQRYQVNATCGIVLAVLFCVMVCLSRLYLGVHSVLDIVAGLILGALFLLAFLQVPEYLDRFLVTHPWSPLTLLLITSSCLILYPSSIYTVTRQDTAVVLGASVGIYVGLWTCHHLNSVKYIDPVTRSPAIVSTLKSVGLAAGRTAIGSLIIFIFRMCFKSAYRFVLSFIVDSKTSAPLFLVISFYFIMYFMVGFNITFLMPHLFRYLAIDRSSYFKEV